jgi:transposase
MSDAALNTLPDDVETLKRMLIERDAVIARVTAERDHYISRLKAALGRLFGPRAERLDPKQLELFAKEVEQARDAADDQDSEALPEGLSAHRRRPRRRRLPSDLPRQEQVHELSEAERRCPCCGEERLVIAREASEQLEYVPAKLWVRRDVQLVYGCPTCRGQVQRAEKPHRAIERSIAGSSLLAHLVTSKFEDHLPLYRIEKILRRSGVELPRSTQVGLLHQVADLMRPLVDLMWKRVRGSPVIHTDDTPMPTQEKGRGRTRTGRLWPYVGRSAAPWDRRGSLMVMRYTSSRSEQHVRDQLAGWSGTLQGDCFGGYVALDADESVPIVHAACWAHARRKFYDARTTDVARSTEAMTRIAALYRIEQTMQEEELDDPTVIAARRNAEARPKVEAFMDWLESQRTSVLPKSPFGQAIAYVLGHRKALERNLDDGRLAIDNNAAEQTIRPVALGRKNFLFAGSGRGGQTMATLMSVVGSARLHKLDVAAYLADVIERIAATPLSRLQELLPERWAEVRSNVQN